MSDELRERAREVWEEVNCFPAPEPDDAFLEATLDQVFGRVWSRPGLERKERRWITLSTIAAVGATSALEVHVRSALVSGDIQLDELKEFALHFAHYGGWPLSSELYRTIVKVAKELESEG
jgi:4-carboxymuconolactone decarboxylase